MISKQQVDDLNNLMEDTKQRYEKLRPELSKDPRTKECDDIQRQIRAITIRASRLHDYTNVREEINELKAQLDNYPEDFKSKYWFVDAVTGQYKIFRKPDHTLPYLEQQDEMYERVYDILCDHYTKLQQGELTNVAILPLHLEVIRERYRSEKNGTSI